MRIVKSRRVVVGVEVGAAWVLIRSLRRRKDKTGGHGRRITTSGLRV